MTTANWDRATDLAFFVLEKTGSVLGKWEGKLNFAEQRALFGKVFGKGSIVVDGAKEQVYLRSTSKFEFAEDNRTVISWKNLCFGY